MTRLHMGMLSGKNVPMKIFVAFVVIFFVSLEAPAAAVEDDLEVESETETETENIAKDVAEEIGDEEDRPAPEFPYPGAVEKGFEKKSAPNMFFTVTFSSPGLTSK